MSFLSQKNHSISDIMNCVKQISILVKNLVSQAQKGIFILFFIYIVI
jgi:hypothetical protein